MILTVAGFPFEIQPDSALSRQEREAVATLGDGPDLPGAVRRRFTEPPWSIRISDPPIGTQWDEGPPRPAEVSADGDRIVIRGGNFFAAIDPGQRSVEMQRRAGSHAAVPLVLRVALCCRLPLAGGLPLHAAGVAAHGKGIVFFGPSGAGKSTISGLSPYPVLSDEFVVLADAGAFEVGGSGFWGTLDGGRAPQGFLPLRALIELEKGDSYGLRRFSSREALLRLLNVVTIPVSPMLWSSALSVVGKILERVPVYRMRWTPSSPPWRELSEDLARDVAEEARSAARESIEA